LTGENEKTMGQMVKGKKKNKKKIRDSKIYEFDILIFT